MEPLFTDFNTITYGTLPAGKRSGQPFIGLSVNIAEETSRLHEAYIRAVLDAGGVPVMIPAMTDADALREIVEKIDGLLMTGGADIGGRYFGEQNLEGLADVLPERDAYDFLLLRLAADRQLPVLGICRGMQVMNVAFGGTMCQDIPSLYPGEALRHSILSPREKPVHNVSITEGSLLASVLGKNETRVNSRHHQCVKEIAPRFRVAAVSPDGIVEAIEAYPSYRMIGVQWHPENMAAEGGDVEMKSLFRFFVSESALFGEAKRIHAKYLTVDSHCDLPMLFEEHTIDIGRRDKIGQVDLVKMGEGKLDTEFVVAYLPQGPRDWESLKNATRTAVSLLEEMRRQVESNSDYAGQALTFADADRLKAEGRKAIFLGVENGYAIGSDIGNLAMFRDMGVVYVTLCHNGANDICDSAWGDPEHGGLSDFGMEVVAEMNRLGLLIDLSHAAETTFYEVLESSTVPVVCTHSSARALCVHQRNLSDDQIRALAAKGGVVQICIYDDFLASGREATLADVADHIDHVVGLVGTDYVGIGSDFDGGGGVAGCMEANEFINITVELLRRGYDETDVARILGGNFRRVLDSVQAFGEPRNK